MEKSKGWEIEQVLIRRMEERYSKGKGCPSVVDFFECQDNDFGLPQFGDNEKRERKALSANGGAGVPLVGGRSPFDGCFPPPANRGVTINGENQSENTPFDCPHIMGGFDGGVEVGFDGTWDKAKFQQLKERLTAAKAAAQVPGDPDKNFILGDRVFSMLSRSAGGHITYNFVFEGGGIKFYIHSNPLGDIQPVRIRYNAEGLIGNDLYFVHYKTVAFLQELGFTVEKEKISRVDLQVMVERDISEFMEMLFHRQFVCTARKYHIHGDGSRYSPETFTLGKEIQICIYDKTQELIDNVKNAPFKLSLMVKNCFGDDWLANPTSVTRVEFRLQRDVLKDMQINSIDDLLQCEAGLAHYCCHTWFRIIAERRKAGHTHEQEVHFIWKEVQDAFEKYFPGVDGHKKEVHRIYDKPLACSARDLERQALGCLAKAAALTMDVSEDVHHSVNYAFNLIRDNAARLMKRTGEKIFELGISAGVIDPLNPRSACVVPAVRRCYDGG